jgi:hypothetical protein
MQCADCRVRVVLPVAVLRTTLDNLVGKRRPDMPTALEDAKRDATHAPSGMRVDVATLHYRQRLVGFSFFAAMLASMLNQKANYRDCETAD